ncbi:MAG TPA: succinyl-diaminopimelate desuccinylase [Alphaproteobacteria bacterium]|nr:succinyl-diaminopimelate desuccinylase [Alphaproteobacteria bacterium]HAJ48563.1 succinyl-diaminopimelate desuccinylase [Alphaproteobacteria bacterium]
MTLAIDAIALTRALIQCPSVTPEDRGAMDVVQAALTSLGFTCHRLPFQSPGRPVTENLYARIGTGAPHLCFAGHTDVVPAGPIEAWRSDPFVATEHEGDLVGRGAVDMKGAIAAFIAAVSQHLHTHGGKPSGSISLLITGDEEGPAVDGTIKVLEWMQARGEVPTFCLVGEPTSESVLGDMIKIGRRGSLTGRLTVRGVEGHVAYPHRAQNPIPGLVSILQRLTAHRFGDANAQFDATNLEVVTVDVGNRATNVIPAEARATFNIRFNPTQTGDGLSQWLRAEVARGMDGHAGQAELTLNVGGEPFLTEPSALSHIVADAIQQVTGRTPVFSTTGGTSDARYISKVCPVAEFGLVGLTMHKTDERVSLADLAQLQAVYAGVLARVFGAAKR